MLDAGSGDMMSPYGGDNGDLMAYNAFPDGLSSTPLSSLGGGYESSDYQQNQHQHQHQHQHQSQHQSQQPSSAVAAAQAQVQANVQLQAKLQAQANQAAQMSQAYALAPKSGSLTTGAAPPPPSKVASSNTASDPGYLENLWQKRRDVAKLCILALAVLLAISAHSAAWHYLREYIETTPQLNEWHELGLRLAYPAIVLIVLWNLKALQ